MTLNDTASALLNELAEQSSQLKPKMDEIRQEAARATSAALRVARAFSGSSFGYHGRLYYGDFEEPHQGQQFSVEWGGLNGLSPLWRERKSEEVKGRIESLSKVDLDSLQLKSDPLLKQAKELRDEILIRLSTLRNQPNFEHEKSLLAEMEKFDWGDDALGKYFNAARRTFPNISRDSEAVMQGEVLPSHTYYEGIAAQAIARCEAIEQFWKLAGRLLRQIRVQSEAHQEQTSVNAAIEAVRSICSRFHVVAVQMRTRHQNRATLNITDEYDVQDLLHCLLRLHFDDVRPEEFTPSFAGSATRMDFLLKREEVVIEAKMIRPSLSDKDVSNELIQDVARYKAHPHCKHLIAFIYDPDARLKNPHGITSDLTQLSTNEMTVEIIVAPKR